MLIPAASTVPELINFRLSIVIEVIMANLGKIIKYFIIILRLQIITIYQNL